MNRILLITEKESDLSLLIKKSCPDVTVITPEASGLNSDDYDALCILGGNSGRSLSIPAPLRVCVEDFLRQNKPVFSEFVSAIKSVQTGRILHTTHHRLVYDDAIFKIDGLSSGDVLDGHENDCIDYAYITPTPEPIFTYHAHVCAHSHIEMSKEEFKKGASAMWRVGNLLVCCFRLCNFRTARLVPSKSFEALVRAVICFIAGEDVCVDFEEPVCTYKKQSVSSAQDVRESVERALGWFENADLLVDGGRLGIKEGFEHHVSARDGSQSRRNGIRADCTAETASAFMLHGLLRNDESALKRGEAMLDFCFKYLQEKKGEHKGLIRWTQTAWETCYQDDVARVLLGPLLRQFFDGTVPFFEEICDGLDYLVKTTSPEGVRVRRTDIYEFNDEFRKKLATYGSGLACAHHNAYYHAALLLAYRYGRDERYLELAERGLSYLMSLYPDTIRETSETEENCRLLFPLAVLYEITGKKEHYEWLCTVMSYLDEHRAKCGAVPEWDTGYKAKCSRNHNGECALLANNGDPVVDLLYSNNWLPLGYAYAYFATGEQRFYNEWCKIASFLLSCQIYSENKYLDGAWTRAFDIDIWESHGVPHDIGWAPCCMETGWTMGEILIGFEFMEQLEKIKEIKK